MTTAFVGNVRTVEIGQRLRMWGFSGIDVLSSMMNGPENEFE